MEEPSVLDYLKSLLDLRRKEKVVIPGPEPVDQELEAGSLVSTGVSSLAGRQEETTAGSEGLPQVLPGMLALPWRSLLALGLALMAQRSLEPAPNRSWITGVALYLLAGAFLVWSANRTEWQDPSSSVPEVHHAPLRVKSRVLLTAIPLGIFAFILLGGNRFTSFNVFIWLLTTLLCVWGFWMPATSVGQWLTDRTAFLQSRQWRLQITPWTLLVVGVVALVLFFRAYQIQLVPPEMVSDHAEKLLDVWDVLQGQTSIFFPRNTGREAMQMYLTALIVRVFGTGLSFLSLKIGTVLAGLLTLPFIYLLGVEIGNRRVGLLAMLFAGIAYWPNVISRVGLRFPLYPLFVAPTLYYLLRGLKYSNRNDFILAGLALGIGLHGYTPIRILPFVVVIAVGMYLIHPQSKGNRKPALFGLLILTVISLVVFLPLLRFTIDNPELFSYRSLTRLGTVERPLPGSAWQIFWGNLWRALTMFAWDDGEIWVHSVTHRPALDVVSGALFHLGVGLLLLRFFRPRYREDIWWLLVIPLLLARNLLKWVWLDLLWLFVIALLVLLLVLRYLRHKRWEEIFWLLAVPLLMLPSILSLAFPSENPSLNRMSGAIVPVFLIIGIAGDWLWRSVTTQLGQRLGAAIAWTLGIFLLIWSATQNYNLVFNQYQKLYKGTAWNTSEMGAVIGSFSTSVGSPDNAWVVAYPHWVDTRLVGMNAGYPLKDYAIWPDQVATTASTPGAKLFLLKPEDEAGLLALQQTFPAGVLQHHASASEGHDFLMYFVPPDE